MTDTYIAHLIDGDSDEQLELESIAGNPRKSLIRAEKVSGQDTDVVWEYELGTDPAIYRRAQSEGYGEGGLL